PDKLGRAMDLCLEGVIRGFKRDDENELALSHKVDRGLALVEETAVARIETRLRECPNRLDGALKGLEMRGEARSVDRPRANAHPGFGKDAERPLGAEDHAIGARPRARSGEAGARERPAWGDHPRGFRQIVDMRVERGEMATCPRCDPAAEGRKFKALWIVPKGEALYAELRFELGPQGTRLNPR